MVRTQCILAAGLLAELGKEIMQFFGADVELLYSCDARVHGYHHGIMIRAVQFKPILFHQQVADIAVFFLGLAVLPGLEEIHIDLPDIFLGHGAFKVFIEASDIQRPLGGAGHMCPKELVFQPGMPIIVADRMLEFPQ